VQGSSRPEAVGAARRLSAGAGTTIGGGGRIQSGV